MCGYHLIFWMFYKKGASSVAPFLFAQKNPADWWGFSALERVGTIYTKFLKQQKPYGLKVYELKVCYRTPRIDCIKEKGVHNGVHSIL